MLGILLQKRFGLGGMGSGRFSRRIYMDHAAVTPIDARVQKVIKKVSRKYLGNPSSLHKEGVAAAKMISDARKSIAILLRGHADEIVFTGSGTEANNLAIYGAYKTAWENVLKNHTPHRLHIITSAIEHPSVLEPIRELENSGVKVTYIGVDEKGLIDPKAVRDALTPETFLISLMMVNNEIGTIQPIRDIAKEIRNFRKKTKNTPNSINTTVQEILFHTDASQAPEYLAVDSQLLGVDMITLDSHKVYGPRGVGMLWVKRGVELAPRILGGKQERGLRSATENLPGIVGFAKALELCAAQRERESARVLTLRDCAVTNIEKSFPQAVFNGSFEKGERLPNTINISFPGLDNEFLLFSLDAQGIACSTRSSCLKDDPGSYVLRAMSANEDVQKSSLRFSFGRSTSMFEIKTLLHALSKAVVLGEKSRALI